MEGSCRWHGEAKGKFLRPPPPPPRSLTYTADLWCFVGVTGI
uniref:Uncharacterized protein n=1 Tax=Anguilla anguilla TaxID=7936 RepID=A0A0E9R781_ANGAN